jgi:membrane carboxypeptidase/penicillin-binding protein
VLCAPFGRCIEEGNRHERSHHSATADPDTAAPPILAHARGRAARADARSRIGAWTVHRIWTQLPSVEHLAVYRPALPLRIFSRDGDLLAEYGVERREFVPLERIPPLMRSALLAAEDAQFYKHGAVDAGGLARATFANLVTGRPGQGGSTISMQVARNFCLTRDKVLSRKLAEILMAYKLERVYSKDKLLELYMNEIYLGERAYGFAAAASVYFGKPLDALDAGEAAVLAGLPKAPSAFNPVVNPARATARRNYVLGRMHALGGFDDAAYREAVDAPLALSSTPPPGILAAPPAAGARVVSARGALALRRDDAAGKTGTSNGSKDVWFAGYSSGVVAVAWLGYDTPRGGGRSATA